MKTLLAHTIFIMTVLFGGDGAFNEGQDTQRLVRDLEHWTLGHQPQIQAYHLTDDVTRYVAAALPAEY